jgi:plasmid stabilization system protein ParE
MRVQFLAAAAKELDEALAHYREQGGSALAERLLAQVEGLLGLVATHPDLGHLDARGVRRFGLKRFPFDLVYRVDGDRLVVVALVHHRRRPGYWMRRLNPGGE